MQQYPDIDAVAIGKFDGMHLGHMALVAELGPRGALVVIDTLCGDLTPAALLDRYVDIPYFRFAFDSIRHLSPPEFVALLTEVFPALRRVVVGDDFKFGYGRSGDAATLRELFAGETVIVPELTLGGEPIRSSRIRHHLALGDIARVSALLGREYRIFARAVSETELLAEDFLLPPAWRYSVLVDGSPDSLDISPGGAVALELSRLVPGREYAVVFTGSPA